MNHAAQLAIIKQMSRHESCGPAGDYQADEQDQESQRVHGGGVWRLLPSFHLGIYIVTANSVVNPVQ